MTSQQLTTLRKLLNLSQRKLASILDVTSTTVSNWELEKSPIPRAVEIAVTLLFEKKVKSAYEFLNEEVVVSLIEKMGGLLSSFSSSLGVESKEAKEQEKSEYDPINLILHDIELKQAKIDSLSQKLFSLLFQKFYVCHRSSGVLLSPTDTNLCQNLGIASSTLNRWLSDGIPQTYGINEIFPLAIKMLEVLFVMGEVNQAEGLDQKKEVRKHLGLSDADLEKFLTLPEEERKEFLLTKLNAEIMSNYVVSEELKKEEKKRDKLAQQWEKELEEEAISTSEIFTDEKKLQEEREKEDIINELF